MQSENSNDYVLNDGELWADPLNAESYYTSITYVYCIDSGGHAGTQIFNSSNQYVTSSLLSGDPIYNDGTQHIVTRDCGTSQANKAIKLYLKTGTISQVNYCYVTSATNNEGNTTIFPLPSNISIITPPPPPVVPPTVEPPPPAVYVPPDVVPPAISVPMPTIPVTNDTVPDPGAMPDPSSLGGHFVQNFINHFKPRTTPITASPVGSVIPFHRSTVLSVASILHPDSILVRTIPMIGAPKLSAQPVISSSAISSRTNLLTRNSYTRSPVLGIVDPH